MIAATTFAGLMATGNLASAGDDPEIHANDATLEMWLWTDANVSPPKYVWNLSTLIQSTRPIGTQDVVTVDWKQNGKVIASQRCPVTQVDKRPNVGSVECQYDRKAKTDLRVFGKVSAQLAFVNGVTDKVTPLRTLNLDVARYWDWDGDGKKIVHKAVYQILGDDLLGSSLLHLVPSTELDYPHPFNPITIDFWVAQHHYDLSRAQFRCSVDGKQIEQELNGTSEGAYSWLSVITDDRLIADDREWVNGKSRDTVKYAWTSFRAAPKLVYKSELWKAGDKPDATDVYVGDHPGQWVCEVRKDGKPLREFRFTVDKEGHIPLHPEQTGGELWFSPAWRMIETRFPQPDSDFSIQPDAIKKHGFFGAAWKHPEAWKPMFDALKKVGTSEVKPPAGAK
jgi:hypothetical protein